MVTHARPRPAPPRTTRCSHVLAAWLTAFALVAGVGGCAWFRSSVNSSPSLRWWLFSNFGAQRMCPEMLKRSAALRLVPNGNAVGRFFPELCNTQVNDAAQTVTLDFQGTGYAWTPVGGRVGFWASAAVEYRMDFYLGEDVTYIWARPARTQRGPEFRMGAVEYKVADWAAQGPAGYLVNTFGAQLLQSQLAAGFTVVHAEEGDEFTLGQISPPQRPPKPFTQGAERYSFANETTEIRSEQVDFLGPFELVEADQALFLRLRLTGPAVDVLVVTRSSGDVWRRGLQTGVPLAPPNPPPVSAWTLSPGSDQQQALRLQPGQYYVVIDNSSRVGSTRPPWSPLGVIGGNTAVVSYAAELGDAG